MNIDIARTSLSHPRFYRAAQVARARTSIAGVVILSALAVALMILGVLMLGVVFVSTWWLLSHIPLPSMLTRALSHVHF